MSLRVTWYRSLRDAGFPRRDYEALRVASPGTTPFNSLAWLTAAERALTSDDRLEVLCLWEAERLILCLPLVRRRESRLALGLTVVRHLGYPLADRVGLVASCEGRAALGRVLPNIRARLPHALLQFNELTGPLEQMAAWQQRSWYAYMAVSCRVPVHAVSPADANEPSGDLRYKLRRARRRCEVAQAVVRRILPTSENIGPWLDSIEAVERVSWKGDRAVGIFSGSTRAWIRDAISRLAAQGQVGIVALEVGNQVVSYRLGLIESGCWYDYNLAYLPEYGELGSGRLLLDEVIRWALDEGWSHVDASRVSLSGSRHQLFERLTDERVHQRWSFYSMRPSGLLHGAADWLWQRLKPRIRDYREKRIQLKLRPGQLGKSKVSA